MGRPKIKRVKEEGLGALTAAELVGYNNSTANYTSAATEVDGAITALDTQVKANADGAASATLTTKGDILGYDTGINRLAVGTDDQVLIADSGEALGVKWADATIPTLTTKGDILGYDTGLNRLAVGTDDQVLIADSGEALGVKWGAVPSVTVPTFTWADTASGAGTLTVAGAAANEQFAVIFPGDSIVAPPVTNQVAEILQGDGLGQYVAVADGTGAVTLVYGTVSTTTTYYLLAVSDNWQKIITFTTGA